MRTAFYSNALIWFNCFEIWYGIWFSTRPRCVLNYSKLFVHDLVANGTEKGVLSRIFATNMYQTSHLSRLQFYFLQISLWVFQDVHHYLMYQISKQLDIPILKKSCTLYFSTRLIATWQSSHFKSRNTEYAYYVVFMQFCSWKSHHIFNIHN